MGGWNSGNRFEGVGVEIVVEGSEEIASILASGVVVVVCERAV